MADDGSSQLTPSGRRRDAAPVADPVRVARRQEQEWPIQQIARLAGTTSRTLRHYDDIGLLKPSRIGANGYRFYDQAAVVRLQQILLLRDLGLGLPAIADVLSRKQPQNEALKGHLRWLHAEEERLERQITALESTIRNLEEGGQIMPQEALDGFDHTHYREEVEERWGADAYTQGDRWWSSLSERERRAFMKEQQDIAAAYGAAHRAGLSPDSDAVQEIAQRQFDWLTGIPGTPGEGPTGPSADYLAGLGEMYVTDPRFRANYDVHGEGTAELVRDSLAVFAQRRF